MIFPKIFPNKKTPISNEDILAGKQRRTELFEFIRGQNINDALPGQIQRSNMKSLFLGIQLEKEHKDLKRMKTELGKILREPLK